MDAYDFYRLSVMNLVSNNSIETKTQVVLS